MRATDCIGYCKSSTVSLSEAYSLWAYLIFLQTALWQSFVTLLLESDDDQGHKDVYEEKGEDDKVNHVKDGHLNPVAWTRALILKRGVHWVFQDPVGLNDQTQTIRNCLLLQYLYCSVLYCLYN